VDALRSRRPGATVRDGDLANGVPADDVANDDEVVCMPLASCQLAESPERRNVRMAGLAYHILRVLWEQRKLLLLHVREDPPGEELHVGLSQMCCRA